MIRISKILLALSYTALISGCCKDFQPTASAFQRNVGPGSTVGNNATDALGSPTSGNTRVPGVSSAGSLGGN